MDLLNGPVRRRILFSALYVSEGAPIGFLWLALPTRMKAHGVSIENITALTSLLVIPWTFKFAWAPLIDVLRSPGWTLKHWVLTAQVLMALTLVPLLWLNPFTDFRLLTAMLFLHAIAAATQDVAIDALCISVTDVAERGRLNGWMQAGMLAGRASMGGGALLLGGVLGQTAVIVVLIATTTFSGVLLLCSTLPSSCQLPLADASYDATFRLSRVQSVLRDLQMMLRCRRTWCGLIFALTGPAAFKAFEVVIGPFLIDRGFTEQDVGTFTAVVMIDAMVLGALVGGQLADRFSRRGFVAASLVFIVACLASIAVSDIAMQRSGGMHLQMLIALTAFGIGVFTVAAYALFMDMTTPGIAATQFSAFMGATNGCESWSTFLMGRLVGGYSYSIGILTLCMVSLLSLPLLLLLGPKTQKNRKTWPQLGGT